MFKSKLEIEGDKLLLDAYFDALSPEQSFATERSSFTIKKERNKIVIDIEAKDATAFRAVSNSLTGLMSIVEKTWLQKTKENGNRK